MILSNKVALVTGGSRGIGKAISLALASAGAKVCITYRDQKKSAEKVVQTINESGGIALALQLEVRDRKKVQLTFKKAEESSLT